MMETRTLLLNQIQIEQKINRLAWQIYEDNSGEQELIVAGIAKNGFVFAQKLSDALRKISPLKITLVELYVNKHSQHEEEIKLALTREQMQNKTVLVVDDVLNSGKTMMYALKPFLNSDIRKLRTVVLVDRNHKRYPVSADFTGFSLATTLQDHVSVEFEKNEEAVYLS
jgi:pyrimidine operon attenuation protein/uracil phosphoribosyltransferase